MAAIRRRGQKWHVQIRRKNHPSLTRSFDTRREASAWARGEETRLDRLQAWRGPVSMHCLSLADLVRRYRDEEVPKKRGAHIETIMLNAFLRSGLAALPLAEIGPQEAPGAVSYERQQTNGAHREQYTATNRKISQPIVLIN